MNCKIESCSFSTTFFLSKDSSLERCLKIDKNEGAPSNTEHKYPQSREITLATFTILVATKSRLLHTSLVKWKNVHHELHALGIVLKVMTANQALANT